MSTDCCVVRKLRDVEDQNRDLLTTVAKREEAVHQANVHTSFWALSCKDFQCAIVHTSVKGGKFLCMQKSVFKGKIQWLTMLKSDNWRVVMSMSLTTICLYIMSVAASRWAEPGECQPDTAAGGGPDWCTQGQWASTWQGISPGQSNLQSRRNVASILKIGCPFSCFFRQADYCLVCCLWNFGNIFHN